MKQTKGITLIALVITIIILLILAGISITTLFGDNGFLKKALKAKEETEIQGYLERIELIRNELRLQKPNYEPPTLQQMQNEFDTNQKDWVKTAEIKEPNEENEITTETLELKTKEGYIFHITMDGTKYKGKGEIKDTSALDKLDALTLKEVGDGKNGGKLVEIRDESGKDYYEIEYQIDSTEGEWKKIKSGETVEAYPGQIIHARLTFEPEKGKIISLKMEDTAPEIVVNEQLDTSNYVRKTPNELANLFQITWGSDGQGEIQYQITGKLKYKEKPFEINFNSKDADSIGLGDLELGNYTVTCSITSSSNKTATATKQNINIANLAKTSVDYDENIKNINAYAIYSEYDLAHFRDLVNKDKRLTINGKLMKDINLSNVCSTQEGSWTPIGEYNSTDSTSMANANIYYNGVFDGANKKIENLYINTDVAYRQSLFSILKQDGMVKNLETNGEITAINTLGRNSSIFFW